MPTVTTVQPSSKREGRWLVEVDGEPWLIVSLETVQRHALGPGKSLHGELRVRVEDEAAALRTLDRALDLLAVRGRSVRDLRTRLLKKGEPEQHVGQAIERLIERGFLDDAAYARSVARARAVGAGMSKRRVRQELYRRGVALDVADEAIARVWTEEAVDTSEELERVARKKLATLEDADEPTRRRRLYGFLARRGYEFDDIKRVLAKISAPTP
jgi:regulatory protein